MTAEPTGDTFGKDAEEASRILESCRPGRSPLYIIGAFDVGVTVFSQQRRALNLAWAMMETKLLSSKNSSENLLTSEQTTNKKIAVIGGGFAGLSFVAGLLRREVDADITLFEQRDTLLPLQHGSDSRWLHPRIYDWPEKGSEASAAMLPVLDWTAARASDVAVQVLEGWKNAVDEYATAMNRREPRLFCNTRHMQIFEPEEAGLSSKLGIEWVGEERDSRDANTISPSNSALGATELFDMVVLAVGFGLERGEVISYWRNDTSGQPSLDQPRRTYIVSGQGDGAIIDLLRLRISQYRQDRILRDIFKGAPSLLKRIQDIHGEYQTCSKKGLFQAFENLSQDAGSTKDFALAKEALTKRLRRDTDVILHLKLKRLNELFDPANTRISFQNKFLMYLLYKCGGFYPSNLEEETLLDQHAISRHDIIRRHGTLRDEQFQLILSDHLHKELVLRRNSSRPCPLIQTDSPKWPGGYFAYGSVRTGSEPARGFWRKEYLPGPTSLFATGFSSAIAGRLLCGLAGEGRLRVTLHRLIVVGNERLLQQCCEYVGINVGSPSAPAGGRTFPAGNGTIGAAYRTKKIVRSKQGADLDELERTMEHLNLNEASRKMARDVDFLLAIPLLSTEEVSSATKSQQVIGVLYIDSTIKEFYIDNLMLQQIVRMCLTMLSMFEVKYVQFDRINNIFFEHEDAAVEEPLDLSMVGAGSLELVDEVNAPQVSFPFQFNFDHADFLPIENQMTGNG